MSPMADVTDATFLATREQLRECIAKMAVAIAEGECTPLRIELEALIVICQDHFLPMEAARVRRWMTP